MDVITQYDVWLIGILICVAFLAGLIDAIAGGGGMLQVPALLLCGLNPVAALATNKVISMVGTTFVVFKYALNNLVLWRFVAIASLPCLFASILGSQLAIIAPDWFLEGLIIISIAVGLLVSSYVKANNDNGINPQSKSKFLYLLTSIGLYDGIAGPGTGSFMVLANNKSLGYNLLVSTAIAKPLNLITNIGAAFIFISADKVVWVLAIPMLIANSIGGWVGGHIAILHGSHYIKKMLNIVLVLMLVVNVGKLAFNF